MPHLPRAPRALWGLFLSFLNVGIQRFAGLPVADRQLPVTSTNHCISRSPVFTSGPAIYSLGVKGFTIFAKLCTNFFFNSVEPLFQIIPPFAPPKGILARAFFQVIVRAK